MSKITITINLNLQQIKEDVWNKTYVTGLRRNTGDNPEQVSLIQAGDEPESERQIYRSIDNAFNSLKAVLGEYLSVISSNLVVINYPAAIPETLTVHAGKLQSCRRRITVIIHALIHSQQRCGGLVCSDKSGRIGCIP